jgi:thiosulfate dehydrogenase (quinone) large subunit
MDDKYTNVQKTSLVILRVLIGWHFMYEGVAKLLKGTWSAAGYLSQARGLLAPFFQWIAHTPNVLTIVNQMNIWGLIAIGLGLILGCFTRWASYAGMLLILLYYLANPPFVGYFYSIPMEGNYLIVNKNLVEMAALFLISVTPSGRWAGLDLLVNKIFCSKK